MFHSKIIDKIFNECLCFLIVTINNCNNKTINWFYDFINYKSFFDIDKHVECIQFVEQFEKSNNFFDNLNLIHVFNFTNR